MLRVCTNKNCSKFHVKYEKSELKKMYGGEWETCGNCGKYLGYVTSEGEIKTYANIEISTSEIEGKEKSGNAIQNSVSQNIGLKQVKRKDNNVVSVNTNVASAQTHNGANVANNQSRNNNADEKGKSRTASRRLERANEINSKNSATSTNSTKPQNSATSINSAKLLGSAGSTNSTKSVNNAASTNNAKPAVSTSKSAINNSGNIGKRSSNNNTVNTERIIKESSNQNQEKNRRNENVSKKDNVTDNIDEKSNIKIRDIVKDCFNEKRVIGMNEIKDTLSIMYDVYNNEIEKESDDRKAKIDETINRKHFAVSGGQKVGKSLLITTIALFLEKLGIRNNKIVKIEYEKVDKIINSTSSKDDKKPDEELKEIFKNIRGNIVVLDKSIDLIFQGVDGKFAINRKTVEVIKKITAICTNNKATLMLEGSKNSIDALLGFGETDHLRYKYEQLDICEYTDMELYSIACKYAHSEYNFELDKDTKQAFIERKHAEKVEPQNQGIFVHAIINQSIKNASRSNTEISIAGGRAISNRLRACDIAHKKEYFYLDDELNSIIGLNKVKCYLKDECGRLQGKNRRGVVDSFCKKIVFLGKHSISKTFIIKKLIRMYNSGTMVSFNPDNIVIKDAFDICNYNPSKLEDELFGKIANGVLVLNNIYDIPDTQKTILEILIKLLRKEYSNTIIILSGDIEKLKFFLQDNGLDDCFLKSDWCEFEDYSLEELIELSNKLIDKYEFRIEVEEAKKKLEELIAYKHKNQVPDNKHGNTKMLFMLLSEIKTNLETRVGNEDVPDNATNLIMECDVPKVEKKEDNWSLEETLDKYIGLNKLKNKLKDWTKIVKGREEIRKIQNLGKIETDEDSFSYHMVFTGNPGTGKTSIAREMANYFYHIGRLKSNKFVEVSKDGLVEEYVGKTAKNTRAIIESAIDGVLFIDEAYALVQKDAGGFGQEAVDTLVKYMEDYSDRLVVIIAGYKDKIKDFINSNPGLQSRFVHYFEFDDYSVEESIEIARKMLRRKGFSISDDSVTILKKIIENRMKSQRENYGNAREIRNIVDEIMRNSYARAADHRDSIKIQEDNLLVVEVQDMPNENNQEKMPETVNKWDFEKELNKYVGLYKLKEQLKKWDEDIRAKKIIIERQESLGYEYKSEKLSYHMVFTGNPGTGKTSIAREMGNYFYHSGILMTNKVIEVGKEGLVGKVVGETAIKTRDVIENALDGVLFIDEAYALVQEGTGNFGQEAIDTLLKQMEDNRDRLVVIVAGYKNDMEKFISSNQGLYSRFSKFFEFDDYGIDDAMEISKRQAQKANYEFSEGAKKRLRLVIEKLIESPAYSNGRTITALMGNILSAANKRIANIPDLCEFVIQEEDVEMAMNE